MASDIRRWRRALSMFAATAVVLVLAGPRAAAQNALVADAELDDVQDNVPGFLPPPASTAAAAAGRTAVIAPSIQRSKPALPPLARWFDVQTGTMATRFRFTETS